MFRNPKQVWFKGMKVNFYETTRHSNPDDCHVHTLSLKNLKSRSPMRCYVYSGFFPFSFYLCLCKIFDIFYPLVRFRLVISVFRIFPLFSLEFDYYNFLDCIHSFG
jgi:hypothetical protein